MIMMQQSQRHYTLHDYFSVEESSEIRHEFFNGEIFAMAGASRNHNRITRNLLTALHAGLRGTPCEPFSGDMRVRTPSGLYTYPDVLIVCGRIELTGDPMETIANPAVLAEVLSDSTRDYDRGEKFTQYRTIPTLKDYLLIEQSPYGVERWHKNTAGEWEQHSASDSQIKLHSVELLIPLFDLYGQVELESL